jgi:hypothetical protein
MLAMGEDLKTSSASCIKPMSNVYEGRQSSATEYERSKDWHRLGTIAVSLYPLDALRFGVHSHSPAPESQPAEGLRWKF